MEPLDLLLAPIYLTIIYFIAFQIRNRYPKGSTEYKYFMIALNLKMIGALGFVVVHQFYYKGGDTFSYYEGAKQIWNVMKFDPKVGLKLLLLQGGEYQPETYWYVRYIYFFSANETYLVVKAVAVLGFISFNSFLIITFLFSFISFTGMWKLYRTFIDIYPDLKKELGIAILFIPSVFFWGSGIMKDTITIGCLGWLTASFYSVFVKNKNILFSSFLVVLCSYLIFQTKAYIFFTLAPGLLFWLISIYRSKIQSTFFKFLITPFVLSSTLLINYFVIEQLAKEEQKFSFEKFVETAGKFQSWHGYLGTQAKYGGGSAYSLGEFEATTLGIIKVAPSAINVTLFRPYFWETRNIVMLISAFESFLILLFTIQIIRKIRWKIFKIIYSNPEVFFCIIFSLVFAFAVGFSSYNFGALVRYKIPCIPFYVSALFIIRHIHQKSLKTSFAHK